MEVLEKRGYKTISNKPSEFLVNSTKQQAENKQVIFNALLHDDKRIIVIKSPLLEKNNFNVIHTGSCITLILTETKKIEKPLYVRNIGLKHRDFTEYERLKSFDYQLPEGYNELIDTKWNQLNKTVEVYFK